jgi:ketosteroid isomerase-like protein
MITAADADGIARLMTESHSFIDSVGHTVSGKAACCAAWRGFFEAFPTYRNEFDSVTERDGTVIMTGRSVCADDSDLDGPAVWTARTVGTLVSEWRVYDDTPQVRRALGIPIPSAPRAARAPTPPA